MFLLMRTARPKVSKSKELITPRINCRLLLGKENEMCEVRGNSWHNKPLLKSKYKFREESFKNHLTNKSIEITKRDLTANQKLLISQLTATKPAHPQTKFR